MPNNYFQFKQFTIEQEKSTMKVCTDSCLFGAWLADKIEKKILEPQHILDIGSGTGLLSLMVSQKSKASTDAVEIDENSYLQTKENFDKSVWRSQLQAFHADIKTWESPVKYDLIISNPPFFENDLKSGKSNQNIAKHNDGLTLTELLSSVSKHVKEDGYFAILLPFKRLEFFERMAAAYNFHLVDRLIVKQTPEHDFFRAMLLFATNKKNSSSDELIIKDEEGNYTEDFNELLKDYYL